MADPIDPQFHDAGRPEPSPSPERVDALPQWRVLLHDDEVHDRHHVIEAIADYTPLTHAAATHRVIHAHHHGTATLLLTHRELAELYYVQLSKQNLIVSIEQVAE